VLSVPSGFASNGVPTGIQIVARSYADEIVFQAGFNYEKLDSWLKNVENRPKI
jgi:Asp-tRNA(Asn)/Glu-tRNA(Gln) amidotransferase A subunit family amidase